jgi:hypothetical protein
MGVNRVFVSQQTLDRWLSEGHIEVEGDTMTLQPDGQQFCLKTAVHFVREVEGGDSHGLLHRVKDLEQLSEMGGEHFSDSVIVGDDAYEVVEGFAGEPIHVPAQSQDNALASGPDLEAATRAAVGEAPGGQVAQNDEMDMLARFFLSSNPNK